jgi:hypothetical protein
MNLNENTIHCIGDSHVSVFTGQDVISNGFHGEEDTLPYFKTYRLGACLAYNTLTEGHGNRSSFFKILLALPPTDFILLSYGEIDCRVHILRQAEKQGKTKYSVAIGCAARYFRFVLEVFWLGYKNLIVYAAPPTPYNTPTPEDLRYNEDLPHSGSYEDRRYVTSVFNKALKRMCKRSGIHFLSVEDVVLKDGLVKDDSFFMDKVHLSQKVMPHIEQEIKGFK